MSLAWHPSQRCEQVGNLAFDAISQCHAVICNATPDFKKIVLRFGGNVVERRHECRSRNHAAVRFSMSVSDSPAEKNSPRSNSPKALPKTWLAFCSDTV